MPVKGKINANRPDRTGMPSRGYLICCVERTGSNLLANALSQTDVAGRPMEYFNPVEQNAPMMRNILGASSLLDGLPKVLIAGSTANGVFGAKIHWNHFRFLGMSARGEWSETARTAMYDLMRSQLPNLLSQTTASDLLNSRFHDMHAHNTSYSLLQSQLPDLQVIWIRRRNMVARAISHFRAARTGVWFRAAETSCGDPVEKADAFDLGEIHTRYLIAAFQEEHWGRFFKDQNISPHCLTYEDLVTDYESTLRRVLEFLEIESVGIDIPPPGSAKQSDSLSAEWEDRYRRSIPKADF